MLGKGASAMMFVPVCRVRSLVRCIFALAITFSSAGAHVGTAIAAGAESPASRPLSDSIGFAHDQPVLDPGTGRTVSSEETGDLGLTRIVPTYDRTGLLWGRRYDPDARFWSGPRPAIVVMHGGGGMNVRYLERARWWADQGYVALVLDSFGSRGIPENWLTFNRFGGNMRAADAVAAVRYLRGRDGVDLTRIHVSGGSQGGWAVLRTLTANAPWSAEAAATIASGIAWYPVCNRTEDGAVPLGPFTRPVLFLEGTGDTATPPEVCADLASEPGNRAAVYAEATHAFDFRGPPRQHAFWHYPMRYDPLSTARALAEAIAWTEGHRIAADGR